MRNHYSSINLIFKEHSKGRTFPYLIHTILNFYIQEKYPEIKSIQWNWIWCLDSNSPGIITINQRSIQSTKVVLQNLLGYSIFMIIVLRVSIFPHYNLKKYTSKERPKIRMLWNIVLYWKWKYAINWGIVTKMDLSKIITHDIQLNYHVDVPSWKACYLKKEYFARSNFIQLLNVSADAVHMICVKLFFCVSIT